MHALFIYKNNRTTYQSQHKHTSLHHTTFTIFNSYVSLKLCLITNNLIFQNLTLIIEQKLTRLQVSHTGEIFSHYRDPQKPKPPPKKKSVPKVMWARNMLGYKFGLRTVVLFYGNRSCTVCLSIGEPVRRSPSRSRVSRLPGYLGRRAFARRGDKSDN